MGRAGSSEVILIFRGTHQVMAAEKNLKQGGVATKVIPVPRALSSDCGLAIRIFPPDKRRAKDILSRSGISPRSVYILREEEMYEEEPF